MVRGDVIDRNQGQAQVAYFLEQSMQCRLVGHRAVDDGGATAAVGEGQPVEPGGPPCVEMSLVADLVPPRVQMAAGIALMVLPLLLPARLDLRRALRTFLGLIGSYERMW
jgi:hypothetical protein